MALKKIAPEKMALGRNDTMQILKINGT